MPGLTQETKSLLRELHIFPRKKMGQHFMIKEEELSFIKDALCLRADEPVLEIGPGLGFLTRRLFEKVKTAIAVEKDPTLAKHLKAYFKEKQLELLQMDILDLDLERDLKIKAPIQVVGNIPYHITSPILEWLVSQRRLVKEAVLTVQWEVALRICATPGNKSWGALSIFVQLYSDVSVIRKISRQSFWPVPKVDSAVMRLCFLKEPKEKVSNEENFFSIVRRSFQKRRKTLLNALADTRLPGFSKEQLAEVFKKTAMDPRRRPETLSIPEWATLANRF